MKPSSLPPRRHCYSLLLGLIMVLTSVAANAELLARLVEQRLGYMKDVAAYKWHQQLPIENLDREKLVLASAVEKGLDQRLTSTSSRNFFQAQISAAKEIQQYWFDQWQHSPESVPATPQDLNSTIRPALIDIGEQIIQALVGEDRDLASIGLEGLSQNAVAGLNIAAREVNRYPDTLAQVLDSGLLRVATTGDYAPFSYLDPGGEKRGIDIELAQDLARSLGVKLRWVETSWPNLMEDFQRGRFDIGMSGISINLQRQQKAFFSAPYHVGGKTPIIRCADRKKYSSLSAIDQPTTRIIVNPGGTNALFVNGFIKRANIRVHPDNRTIFDEIVAGRADLMITDKIEVQLQSGIHPQLCASAEIGTLTFSEKAFLLPQDMIWKQYVDTWLKLRIGEGVVAAIFDRHLVSKL